MDPFSGKEIAYERDGNAWRFYSVSDNLTDDGGTEGERPFELDFVVRFPPPDVEPFEPEQEESN